MAAKPIGLQSLFVLMLAGAAARPDSWSIPPAARNAVAIDGSARVEELSSADSRLQRSIKVYTRSRTEAETLSWQADLVNCPVKVFVAPGGKSVVTMDSWGRVGSDPLVFYGDGGTILKHYGYAQRDLVTPAEAAKIQRSTSSFWWSEGAHAEFTADGDYFWMWLPSGRVMIFDSKTGIAIDAKTFRLEGSRGRPAVIRTVDGYEGTAQMPHADVTAVGGVDGSGLFSWTVRGSRLRASAIRSSP